MFNGQADTIETLVSDKYQIDHIFYIFTFAASNVQLFRALMCNMNIFLYEISQLISSTISHAIGSGYRVVIALSTENHFVSERSM